jgi:hypothetical protein
MESVLHTIGQFLWKGRDVIWRDPNEKDQPALPAYKCGRCRVEQQAALRVLSFGFTTLDQIPIGNERLKSLVYGILEFPVLGDESV